MSHNKLGSIVVLIGVLFLVAAAAVAQHHGRHHQEPHHLGMLPYEASREITLHGVVQKVMEQDCPSCEMGSGTHLWLESEGETVEVHLGPTRFLAEKHWVLEKGDQVTITGAKVPWNGNSAVLARKLTRDEETLTLRDEKGIPLWSAGRRRP